MRTVLETTAREAPEAIRRLGLADNEIVRISVGTKQAAYDRFFGAAAQLQEEAASHDMTDEAHDRIMASLNDER